MLHAFRRGIDITYLSLRYVANAHRLSSLAVPQSSRSRVSCAAGCAAFAALAAASSSTAVEAEAQPQASAPPPPRAVYPPLEPFRTGELRVSSLHTLYYEECGVPDGQPVIFLHGGPGGGCNDGHRRFFDPQRYRIILFDQRGCGRSTPFASLEENTTWHLVSDIEALRTHLGIKSWSVFGGSWGSTLALAYAQSHPASVSSLVLRGIFLLRPSELDWYYEKRGGAEMVFPDAFEDYAAPVAAALERGESLISAYRALLTGDDEAKRLEAAGAWTRWEMRTSSLRVKEEDVAKADDAQFALPFARIENHFFANKGWFESEMQLLENVDKIRHIPAVIVQGRYDVVCPMRSAWDLHRAWPEAKLVVVADAGHSANEPGISAALCDATDSFRTK
jgi:proline iminopeptidase